jgi:hypothetical protein
MGALENVGFELLVVSAPEYTQLVAEIYYDGRFVALVNQERGAGLFDVETPGNNLVESKLARKVDIRGFVAALNDACERLSVAGEK